MNRRIASLFLIAVTSSSLSSVSVHVAALGIAGIPSRTAVPRSSTLGFAQNAPTESRSKRWSSQSPIPFPSESPSPLPIVACSAESSPIVQSLDHKMKKVQTQRDKYEAKLIEYSHQLAQLEQTKQHYLEGGTELGQVEATFNETALRSAIKAMTWRILAGSITFCTSLKFSQSIGVALKMVGSDFASKAATMFIGERLMNKSQAGRSSGVDSAKRSIAKALIWRLFAICNTLAVCIFVTKDFSMAYKVAGSDALFKTALMVAFERLWANIEWGKDYQIDFTI